MTLDPITLEILNTKVTAATEEMGYALQRTGRTLYVKETADFATALATPSGHFFAYPRAIGVSGFVDLDCGPTIASAGSLQPGDVIITNHPYDSKGLATHGPDLHLIKPYFHEGEIICYGWSFLHSSDVGGRVPSSISPTSHELYQEGLMLPPLKLICSNRFNSDVIKIFRANCRTPDENMGDLQAMIAALNVGEARVHEIISRHGAEAFRNCQQELIDYSAQKSREVLRKIPNGSYSFVDYMDDDIVSDYPILLKVIMTARDGLIHLDFSGTDPQVRAAFNLPTSGKRHAWLTIRLLSFILTHDSTAPMNAGLFEPITVTVPKGSILNPEAPAAVGVRHATAVRVNDLLNGALSRALPDVMPASSGGAMVPLVFAQDNLETGSTTVAVAEPLIGGTGARLGHDGADGRDSSISNLANNPIESVEGSMGVVVRRYAVRPDSGGAGQWRGGNGITLELEVTAESGRFLGRGMERLRFRPWGIRGGCPGAPMMTIFNPGSSDERVLGRIDVIDVRRGDRLVVHMPGGGGYGDPFERDPSLVLRDIRRGFVSLEAARRDYGVVVANDAVDTAATAKARGRLSPVDLPAFRFGPERDAWERALPEALLSSHNERLLEMPTALRQRERKRIYAAALRGSVASNADFLESLSEPEAVRARFLAASERLADATTSVDHRR